MIGDLVVELGLNGFYACFEFAGMGFSFAGV